MRSLLCVLLVVPWVAAAAPADGTGPRPATRPAATTAPHDKAVHSGEPPLPADPRKMLRVKWDAVLVVLQNDDLDRKGKEAAIEKIVIPIIDLPLMAKLSLGKTNWRKFTAAQRARFVELFTERMKATYRQKIARYSGQRVIFKPYPPARTGKGKTPAARKPPKGAVYIPIELVSGDTRIAILHKLRKSGRQWKMYDTEMEGVSILLTYRSQFNDILRKGTVEGLLSRLAKPASS